MVISYVSSHPSAAAELTPVGLEPLVHTLRLLRYSRPYPYLLAFGSATWRKHIVPPQIYRPGAPQKGPPPLRALVRQAQD